MIKLSFFAERGYENFGGSYFKLAQKQYRGTCIFRALFKAALIIYTITLEMMTHLTTNNILLLDHFFC
jgi:hypothetical protein